MPCPHLHIISDFYYLELRRDFFEKLLVFVLRFSGEKFGPLGD